MPKDLSSAKALEALIDRYGLKATLEAITDICDAKAEHMATKRYDVGEAKCWAKAANDLGEAQQRLSTLDL